MNILSLLLTLHGYYCSGNNGVSSWTVILAFILLWTVWFSSGWHKSTDSGSDSRCRLWTSRSEPLDPVLWSGGYRTGPVIGGFLIWRASCINCPDPAPPSPLPPGSVHYCSSAVGWVSETQTLIVFVANILKSKVTTEDTFLFPPTC